MIKIHCNQLGEFIRVYVFDWHVLSALVIPLIFSLIFPVYWLLICPKIWIFYPELFHPRSWLIAYWLFASFVWFIFLAICFYRTRNDHRQLEKRATGKKTESTEDLWSEDRYLPDPYLPAPEYLVSLNTVQPMTDVEERREVDETWDYNYEETFETPRSQPDDRLPFENRYHSLGILRDEKILPESTWRKFSEPNELFSSQKSSDVSTDDERHMRRGLSGRRSKTLSSKLRPHYFHPSRMSRPLLHHPTHPSLASTHPRRPSSTSSYGGMGVTRHLRPVRFDHHHRRPRPLSYGPLSSTSSNTEAELFSDHGSSSSNTLETSDLKRKTLPSYCPRSPRHVPLPPLRKHNLITRGPPSFRLRPHSPRLQTSSLSDTGPPPPQPLLLPRTSMSSRSDGEDVSPRMKRKNRPPNLKLDTLKDSLTDDELKSLQEVCEGRVKRKDSLVSDAKFDNILASLQSLASELEKDFLTATSEDDVAVKSAVLTMEDARKNSAESVGTDECSSINSNVSKEG